MEVYITGILDVDRDARLWSPDGIISITAKLDEKKEFYSSQKVLHLKMDDVWNDGFFNTKSESMIFPNDKHLDDVYEFVNKNKLKRIMVHCTAGISRSSSVAFGIMKKYSDMPDNDLIKELFTKFPKISPNIDMLHLVDKRFNSNLFGTIETLYKCYDNKIMF